VLPSGSSIPRSTQPRQAIRPSGVGAGWSLPRRRSPRLRRSGSQA